MSNYIAMVSLSFALQQGERFNQPSDNPLVNPNASFTKSSCTTLISQRRTARCSKLAPDFLQRQKSIGFLPNELNKWRLMLLFLPFCPQLDIIFSFFHILLWICSLKHRFVDAMACHGNMAEWCSIFQHLFTSFMKFSRRKGLWITVLGLF